MQLILLETMMNVFLYLCTGGKILVAELETLEYGIWVKKKKQNKKKTQKTPQKNKLPVCLSNQVEIQRRKAYPTARRSYTL